MGEQLTKILKLAKVVDPDLRDNIADMVVAAGQYVSAVVAAECAVYNLEGLTGGDKRRKIEETDKKRTVAHNTFISTTNLVNRIAEREGFEPVYAGGTERREYGDFAGVLVKEIFDERT